MIKEFMFEQKGGKWIKLISQFSFPFDIVSLEELYFYTFKYIISPCYCQGLKESSLCLSIDLSFVLMLRILEPKLKYMSYQIKGLNQVDSRKQKSPLQRDLHSIQKKHLSPTQCIVLLCLVSMALICNYPSFFFLPFSLQCMLYLIRDLVVVTTVF